MPALKIANGTASIPADDAINNQARALKLIQRCLHPTSVFGCISTADLLFEPEFTEQLLTDIVSKTAKPLHIENVLVRHGSPSLHSADAVASARCRKGGSA